jgi:DNA mismatch repair protein MSH3
MCILLIKAVQPSTGDVVYDEFEDGFMRGEFETRALHLQPCEIIIAGEITSATKKVVSHLSINTYAYLPLA